MGGDNLANFDLALLQVQGNATIPAELDLDLGMNLISAEFDIVVVNRVNERLYGKPVSQLLGKKCYAEFEKRDSVCPKCPGAEALRTGLPCTKENEGIRDDGSHFVVLCTAYPVLGPGNKPLGFIELERDISSQKEHEKTRVVLERLRFTLARADACSWVLRHALDAALTLDGVESGCVFSLGSAAARRSLVSTRGSTARYASLVEELDPDRGPLLEVRRLEDAEATCPSAAPQTHSCASMRIRSGEATVALLFLGLSCSQPGGAMRIALEALGELVAGATSRIQVENRRRQQRARLRDVLQGLPIPVMCIDSSSGVTLCNRAAEKLSGHAVGETLSEDSPWLGMDRVRELSRLLAAGETVQPTTIGLDGRSAGAEERALFVAPFLDQIDDVSKLIIVTDSSAL